MSHSSSFIHTLRLMQKALLQTEKGFFNILNHIGVRIGLPSIEIGKSFDLDARTARLVSRNAQRTDRSNAQPESRNPLPRFRAQAMSRSKATGQG
jgi:hypothetical protein